MDTDIDSDSARLELLRSLDILDSGTEPAFDALVRMASLVCACPISLVSLIDLDRQFFKARVGMDATETPRDQAFCAHAIRGSGLMEVPDATRDERFSDNPLVTGGPGIRFYAGQPILYDGVALGTICVIDRVPRALDAAQRTMLEQLSVVLADLLRGRMGAVFHRREQQRLREFGHLSGDWLWETDASHRCAWVSGDTAARTSGVLASFDGPVLGRRLQDFEILDRHGRATGGPGLLGILDRGEAFSDVIVRISGPTGRRLVALTAKPMRDAAGRLTGFRGSSRDVTERVATDLTLQDAHAAVVGTERRLRALTDNLPALISYVDRDERYTYVNAHYCRVFGVDAGRMIGRTMRESHDATMYATAEASIRRVLSGQRSSFYGTRTVDGQSLHYQTIFVPDHDADGSIAGFYAMTFDLTRQKTAESRLAASERLLRGVTDNVPGLVCYVGMDDRYQFANATYARWLGVDHLAMVGKTVDEVFGPDDIAAMRPHVARARGGERVTYERRSTKGDRTLHYLVDYAPDIAEDGSVLGLYALTTDITARREAELQVINRERRLRDLTDALPVLISYIDADGCVTYANETYLRWLGADRSDVVGRSVRDVVRAGLYAQCGEYLRRCLAGERVSFEVDSTVLGAVRHLETTFLPDVGLKGRVVGVTTLSVDVTDRIVIEKRLSRLAHVDALTGLPNRLRLDMQLAESAATARRDGYTMALMFLDVDHFKTINDTLGHGVGDEVLKEFARRLLHSVRPRDFVARLGGDEFVVVLDRIADIDEARRVARKILHAVDLPFVVGRSTLSVTTSVGIALYDDGIADAAEMLAKADAALYRAKQAGRNTFAIAA
jgi:diguanylate cyclase (GGDEF)-like protein/PAS domain S-box-containing protein